jgi:hypothetical protein
VHVGRLVVGSFVTVVVGLTLTKPDQGRHRGRRDGRFGGWSARLVNGEQEDERPQEPDCCCEVAHRKKLLAAVLPFRVARVRKSLASPHANGRKDTGMTDEQHDIDDRHDSIVVEGDDKDHVLPPTELDPYTPEPDPSPKAQTALWIALAVVVIMIVAVLIATLR